VLRQARVPGPRPQKHLRASARSYVAGPFGMAEQAAGKEPKTISSGAEAQ
jgi:hypothetical protein